MSATLGAWPGCHGVRLGPVDLCGPYGTSTGQPFLDAEIARGDAGPPGDHEVWRLTAEVSLPAGPVAVDQTLTQRADGTYHLGTAGGGVAMAVDVAAARLTIEGAYDTVAWQLVATIGVPLLLHHAGVLVVHASAAARDGGAVLVAGTSGSGKSSLLVGLIDRGWSAVSEDMCAIDLRPEQPLVWPGPPWVRRAGDGPAGATVAFRTPDKTAWDLSPWREPGPVPLRSLTFLEPPGGEQLVHRVLAPPEALSVLARHAVWLGEPDERASQLFPRCVRLLGAVPAASMRVPLDPGWLDLAHPVLG